MNNVEQVTPNPAPLVNSAPTATVSHFLSKKFILAIVAILIGVAIFSYYFLLAGGKACGGFAGETGPNACPSGYACIYPNKGSDQQGFCVKSFSTKQPIPTIVSSPTPISQALPTAVPNGEKIPVLSSLKSGLPFDTVIKAAEARVLGEQTGPTKNIPVQVYAYEDNNGNGVREPDDQGLGFMPVDIYDSPFSDNPIQKLNSTQNGWASALIAVGSPYQLIVNPVPTKDYFPTTKPIILSEKNNFAVVGYQKKQSVLFHISVFAFEDVNKDSNFNYDDKNEKSLFLAPFKFYQQNGDGTWEPLPNSINSTDTGWATTTLDVRYPYKVKVEAGDLNNLAPSNKELVISNNNATLIFPYISK